MSDRPTIPCPNCSNGCETCGGDGHVPAWLTDPNIVGEEAAASWRTDD